MVPYILTRRETKLAIKVSNRQINQFSFLSTFEGISEPKQLAEKHKLSFRQSTPFHGDQISFAAKISLIENRGM